MSSAGAQPQLGKAEVEGQPVGQQAEGQQAGLAELGAQVGELGAQVGEPRAQQAGGQQAEAEQQVPGGRAQGPR